ncbi:unnamed protein product [Parascedosporium putredinis]|uniref:Uncharacterized protein n=1 Tax=Parascedosporium putredinis TaxID=1442378 RepID=A0A9P1GY62_9PEZI|nr:unnamed protein product [Parascedosporium putredinis]CAI7991358.1 unnamed protein product [Parascedosporium putredinis]
MGLISEVGIHTVDYQNMAYEEYVRLNNQHERIRESLDLIRASSPFSDSTTTSPSLSPTRGAGRQRFASPPVSRRDNRTLETILDETTLCEIATQEQQLLDVNEAIKRALTELLNCDLVRADKPFRTWVQGRLMQTEKELRSRRRRRGVY